MQEFAHNGLVTASHQESPEQRLQRSLEQPGASNTLSVAATTKITKARIAYALAELAQMNVVNAHLWLQRVAEVNPKTAFELYLQLLEFSAPKQKAVEHSIADPTDKQMNNLTLTELEALARSVVHTQ